jgi:RNA methyltransferase, TrmH family
LRLRNPKVQRLRRLLAHRREREDDGHFVVEGPVLIGEAVDAGWTIEAQFAAPDVEAVGAGGPVHRLASGVAERVSDTQTPSGLFAVVATPDRDADRLRDASFAVVLDGIADPGNLGTILRSAEAAGVDIVVTTPGTADVFSPKVVRASAGALFRVPVVAATLADIAAAGLRLVGTSSHHGRSYVDADWSGRMAIVAGSEAHGLDDSAPVEEWVRIEHVGRAESLNVAMAITILCFEAAQHRKAGT